MYAKFNNNGYLEFFYEYAQDTKGLVTLSQEHADLAQNGVLLKIENGVVRIATDDELLQTANEEESQNTKNLTESELLIYSARKTNPSDIDAAQAIVDLTVREEYAARVWAEYQKN